MGAKETTKLLGLSASHCLRRKSAKAVMVAKRSDGRLAAIWKW